MTLKALFGGAADQVSSGLAMSLGFFPVTEGVKGGNTGILNPHGTEVRQWGNSYFQARNRTGFMSTPMSLLSATNVASVRVAQPGGGGSFMGKGYGLQQGTGWGAPAMSLGAVGFSAYFVYQGYQENGFKGAFDAAVVDVAANTATHSLLYTKQPNKSMGALGGLTQVNATWGVLGWKSPGLTMMGIGMGAYQGAALGQSVAGAPGAFAGAYLGGQLARSPGRAFLSALAIGGAYTVGKGAYNLLKTGYRKAQSKRSIDTAGDTASFFTQNAHTMRARAVQAMHKSHTNARSALGQEASFMHMNRDYFSTYRRMGNMM